MAGLGLVCGRFRVRCGVSLGLVQGRLKVGIWQV